MWKTRRRRCPTVDSGQNLVEAARAELAEVDPYLILVDPEPLSAVLGRETARDTFASLLVSVFAALAVSLAALGVYGILSYDVSRSRREIALRMALGAKASEVRAMVVRRGPTLSAMGVATGHAECAFVPTRSFCKES